MYNNILISNNILNINNNTLLVYISLQLLCNNTNINYYINIDNIIGLIYNTLDIKRSEKENIKEALIDLYSRGIINQCSANTYIINSSDVKPSKDYTIISFDAFQKLKTAPELLKHYIWIKKSMNYNIVISNKRSVISFMKYDYFIKNENITESTIKRYNKKLQELQLIYINNGIYSLYENKEAADYWNEHVWFMNNSRSIMAKYNAYCKHPNKYSPEEKAEIRESVNKYNEYCIQLGKCQPDYLGKVKDLEIFDLF